MIADKFPYYRYEPKMQNAVPTDDNVDKTVLEKIRYQVPRIVPKVSATLWTESYQSISSKGLIFNDNICSVVKLNLPEKLQKKNIAKLVNINYH